HRPTTTGGTSVRRVHRAATQPQPDEVHREAAPERLVDRNPSGVGVPCARRRRIRPLRTGETRRPSGGGCDLGRGGPTPVGRNQLRLSALATAALTGAGGFRFARP